MTDVRVTTQVVKLQCVSAAVRLLEMAGCVVSRRDEGDVVVLSVVVPEDPADMHGARLQAAIADAGSS